jgi:3-keto-5-aminohexanoate cleavage enzyme
MGRSWYTDSYSWMEKVSDQDPLIITCAVNGGIQGREAHPLLPEKPEDIAAQAKEAYDAGASVVHIHARDPENWADCSLLPEVWQEVNALVRENCPDIVINNSTGGGPTTTMEARIACLDALPEMASLNMGPDMSRFQLDERRPPLEHPRDAVEIDVCLPFTYGFIEQLAAEMRLRGIRPEMEIYQPGQYWVSSGLIEKQLIEPPYVFQFVMGAQTSLFPTPANLIAMFDELPDRSMPSVIGIGRFQWPMVAMSIILGGNVRVGLEDNLYLERGRKLRGNGEAVEKVVRLAGELNREIASPQEARSMLGLPAAPRVYPAASSSPAGRKA